MTKAEAAKILIIERDSWSKNPNLTVDKRLYDAYDIAIEDLEQSEERIQQAFYQGQHDAYLHIKATSDLCFIPVSEALPKKQDEYLILLGNGDIFNCEFDPDFTNEEHENGAFVYYSLYHDSETFAVVGVWEGAVDDVVAWMPFKGYKPKKAESEV
jgi:hypothetical protein